MASAYVGLVLKETKHKGQCSGDPPATNMGATAGGKVLLMVKAPWQSPAIGPVAVSPLPHTCAHNQTPYNAEVTGKRALL